MQLAALHTFLAIVETGSLVRASQRLNVSQSTVTARLKALEGDLGQTLLRRKKAAVALTASGYKFKRYAEAMTDLWRQARQETSLPDGVEAVCNLGCHMDLWPRLGRPLVNAMRRDRPTTALSAWPGARDQLDEWLATGLVDAALTYQPSNQENRTIHALPEERLILVSTRPDVSIKADPGYVYVDSGEDFGRRHTAAYADAGIAKVSFGSAAWALDFLSDQGGSAYLPERLAAPGLANGTLHVLRKAPAFTRNVYLVTNDAAEADWPWLAEMAARLAD